LDRILAREGIIEDSANARELQENSKLQTIAQAMDETAGGAPYPNTSFAMVN
jgi:hypothetical protein